jgi:hypothetical protein
MSLEKVNLLNFLGLRYKVIMYKIDPRSIGQRTLPDTGPEDIPIVDVHHYPLTIQRVFVNRANA